MSILFYEPTEKPYGVFSNFYRSPITVDGQTYPTTEHYYQCQKFGGTQEAREYAELIRTQTTPMKAKALATQKIAGGYPWRTALNPFIQEYLEKGVVLREDWEKVKDNVMRRAIYAKFATNEKLCEILRSSQGHHLVEHTTRDAYWGDGPNQRGKNMLGRVLMKHDPF